VHAVFGYRAVNLSLCGRINDWSIYSLEYITQKADYFSETILTNLISGILYRGQANLYNAFSRSSDLPVTNIEWLAGGAVIKLTIPAKAKPAIIYQAT
jgi:hypothetical protein